MYKKRIIIRYHDKELYFFYSKEEEDSACRYDGQSSEEEIK